MLCYGSASAIKLISDENRFILGPRSCVILLNVFIQTSGSNSSTSGSVQSPDEHSVTGFTLIIRFP
jgi:hypothetical protein